MKWGHNPDRKAPAEASEMIFACPDTSSGTWSPTVADEAEFGVEVSVSPSGAGALRRTAFLDG